MVRLRDGIKSNARSLWTNTVCSVPSQKLSRRLSVDLSNVRPIKSKNLSNSSEKSHWTSQIIWEVHLVRQPPKTWDMLCVTEPHSQRQRHHHKWINNQFRRGQERPTLTSRKESDWLCTLRSQMRERLKQNRRQRKALRDRRLIEDLLTFMVQF